MKPAATSDIDAPASVASVRSLHKMQRNASAAVHGSAGGLRMVNQFGAFLNVRAHAAQSQLTWAASCRSPHCAPAYIHSHTIKPDAPPLSAGACL